MMPRNAPALFTASTKSPHSARWLTASFKPSTTSSTQFDAFALDMACKLVEYNGAGRAKLVNGT